MKEQQHNEFLKAYTKEAFANIIKTDIRQRFPEPYASMYCQQFDNKKNVADFFEYAVKLMGAMSNHKQWAEMVLQGIKQRLHECGKI